MFLFVRDFRQLLRQALYERMYVPALAFHLVAGAAEHDFAIAIGVIVIIVAVSVHSGH